MSASTVPKTQKQGKPDQRFLWAFPIVIFIVVVFSTLGFFKELISLRTSQTPTPTPPPILPTSVISITPTLPYTPSPTIGADAEVLPLTWSVYKNTYYFPGLGISLIFPYGWKVTYRKSTVINPVPNFLNRIDFDFLPAGQIADPNAKDGMGWGGLSITVYTHVYAASDWIAQTYPPESNRLMAFPDSTIGNMPAYLVAPKADVSSNDPIWAAFTPRDIVLGNRYIYEFTFSLTGAGNYQNIIKRAIYPFLHFD